MPFSLHGRSSQRARMKAEGSKLTINNLSKMKVKVGKISTNCTTFILICIVTDNP